MTQYEKFCRLFHPFRDLCYERYIIIVITLQDKGEGNLNESCYIKQNQRYCYCR